MKIRFRPSGSYFAAWYLIPTLRFCLHRHKGRFINGACYLMWLKWDLIGVTW